MKLGLALIVSNIFFFILFSNESVNERPTNLPTEGWVEVQFEPLLLTPFQSGKKVLIIQRKAGKKIEGVLKDLSPEVPGRITVLVKENEADALFSHSSWEVLPYLRKLTLASVAKGINHEIRY
jgi:hypothetical protein